MNKSSLKGALFALTSGLCFALLGVSGTSLITTGFTIQQMLFWRFFGATIILALFGIKELFYINRYKKAFLHACGYGFFLYVPSSLCYFYACQKIGTGLGMVLFFSYPLFIVLINYLFYKKSINRTTQRALITVIAGIALLAPWHQGSFDCSGIILGLVAALIYTLYVLASAKNNLPPILATIGLCIGATVVLTPQVGSFIPTGVFPWAQILFLSLICTALPALFFLQSLRFIDPARAALFTVLEPIFALLFGVLFLHEQLVYTQLIGSLLLVYGAFIMLRTKE